jgi:hypothetical protein
MSFLEELLDLFSKLSFLSIEVNLVHWFRSLLPSTNVVENVSPHSGWQVKTNHEPPNESHYCNTIDWKPYLCFQFEVTNLTPCIVLSHVHVGRYENSSRAADDCLCLDWDVGVLHLRIRREKND